MTLLNDKKRRLGNKYDTTNLLLETYNYDVWFQNEELTDKEESVDLSDMLSLEGEKIKEGKGLNILLQKTINQTSNVIKTNKS